jgi:hypothetical protein
MVFYDEKRAEKFLEKSGFNIVDTFFVRSKNELEDKIKSLDFPVVIKVSGSNIIHKKKVNGVFLNVEDENSALSIFDKLMQIKDAEGVLVQKQISGVELFFGIEKTPEFGHVLVFGKGGSKVEEEKDVTFRVCPLDKNEADNMVRSTQIGKKLNNKEKEIIVKCLFNLCKFSKENPQIKELDINPLILTDNLEPIVVDARMVGE